MSGLYLYAIVGKRPRGDLGSGIAGGKLSCVRAGGAWVVVERAAAPVVSPTALAGHDRVVRRIAKRSSAVLPFRFGTTAQDSSSVAALLEPLRRAVATSLALVDECAQYTLRVYGEVAPPPKPDPKAGPGTRFLDARLAARRVPEIAPITEATNALIRATRSERHDRPPLVASVYHLVAKTDARAYRSRLVRAAKSLVRVRVETSGPWPPYAFAELP